MSVLHRHDVSCFENLCHCLAGEHAATITADEQFAKANLTCTGVRLGFVTIDPLLALSLLVLLHQPQRKEVVVDWLEFVLFFHPLFRFLIRGLLTIPPILFCFVTACLLG